MIEDQRLRHGRESYIDLDPSAVRFFRAHRVPFALL